MLTKPTVSSMGHIPAEVVISGAGADLCHYHCGQRGQLLRRWLHHVLVALETGARIDLLRIGEQARGTGYVTWPKAEMRMSVVGFEHVFAEAVEKELAPEEMVMKLAPLHVLALLKTVAYMDDSQGCSKDLEDLGRLMEQYELRGSAGLVRKRAGGEIS